MAIERLVAQDLVLKCALGLGLAVWLLGCAWDGDYERYSPPAWKDPIGYSLTRETARTAGGPAPVLIVRLESASLPEPVLTWSPIPEWIDDAEDIDALPFLPIPDIQLRVHAELEGCAEAAIYANPEADRASAVSLTPEQDVLLAPLAAKHWAALPEDPCAIALRYGTPPDRRGTWLQVVTRAGVVSEYLVAEHEPRYWALVPVYALAETTGYVLLAGLVAGLVGAELMLMAFLGGLGG